MSQGEQLVARFRCAACHTLPGVKDAPPPNSAKSLAATSDWSRSCAGESDAKSNRPGYRLADDDRSALKAFFSTAKPPACPECRGGRSLQGRKLPAAICSCSSTASPATSAKASTGRSICCRPGCRTSCLPSPQLTATWRKLVPAMTPPALNSVGDKLHRRGPGRCDPPPRRAAPAVSARADAEVQPDRRAARRADGLFHQRPIAFPVGQASRRPDDSAGETPAPQAASPPPARASSPPTASAARAATRSARVLPDKAPLNARGPDLSMLGEAHPPRVVRPLVQQPRADRAADGNAQRARSPSAAS